MVEQLLGRGSAFGVLGQTSLHHAQMQPPLLQLHQSLRLRDVAHRTCSDDHLHGKCVVHSQLSNVQCSKVQPTSWQLMGLERLITVFSCTTDVSCVLATFHEAHATEHRLLRTSMGGVMVVMGVVGHMPMAAWKG